MGDIVKHITELLATGNNFEELRPTYRPLGISFFDAMDGEGTENDGCRVSDLSPAATVKDRDTIEDKP